MKAKNKNGWIPVLMAVSQLLLAAFVIYWLFGQYNNERESLNKEMRFEFVQSQNLAVDSTLHVMLKPFLEDSLVIRDSIATIDLVGSTAHVDSVRINSYISPDGTSSNRLIQFEITDSLHPPIGSSANYEITAFPHREALLRGVKMIIRMSEDSTKTEGNGFSSIEVDSAIFLDIASDRLKKTEHSSFEILWYEDSIKNDSLKTGRRILFHSGITHPGMIYEITNFKPFLVKKIIPQILFGILLLLLTGSAFIFTYRSLKRQMLLNTLRNEFISNVSHELKTPVSTVKVALEALQNYDQKKDKSISEEYLKMASLEMDRLDLLIQKILNQSLLESRQLMVKRERFDLIMLIKTVIDSFRPRLEKENGEIIFNPDLEEIIVCLDNLYFQGVLINLFDNALKYGGEPPQIIISIREDHRMIYIDVVDNGPGIPGEFHDRVFERFFRVPSGDRHNVKGYGLGLSFAKEVMEQHEGSIKVDNNPDGGSIFTISLLKTDED